MGKNVPEISVNPLVEFVFASECRKKAILKQQMTPSNFMVAPYRTARAAFSKFFIDEYDVGVLMKAIEKLQNRETPTNWSKRDKENSIEALRHFLMLEFPFKNLKCSFVKPSLKSYMIKGVNIIVAPDLILEWEKDGILYSGAVKFSIKKKALTLQEGQLTASLLNDFLKNAFPDNVIDSKYCICIDVMNSRLFLPPADTELNMHMIEAACLQIQNLWAVA